MPFMTDPRCGKVSRANDTDGHCTRCHRTWVGEEAFTRHQRHEPEFHCLDPETATIKGRLVFEKRDRPGTTDGHAWGLRLTDAGRERLAAHLAALRRRVA